MTCYSLYPSHSGAVFCQYVQCVQFHLAAMFYFFTLLVLTSCILDLFCDIHALRPTSKFLNDLTFSWRLANSKLCSAYITPPNKRICIRQNQLSVVRRRKLCHIRNISRFFRRHIIIQPFHPIDGQEVHFTMINYSSDTH